MQDQLFNMLMQRDEITWKNIIYDLVKSEEMDPWDIDISILTRKYLDTIKELKKHNFFLSGKVLLASAILLKIKSDKLLKEKVEHFDNMLFNRGEEEILEQPQFAPYQKLEPGQLVFKVPQLRKRKVSLNDLIGALHKAIEVNERKVVRKEAEAYLVEEPKIPERTDITQKIKDLYDKIRGFFVKKEKVMFTNLVKSDRREDKIAAFVPLLHFVMPLVFVLLSTLTLFL